VTTYYVRTCFCLFLLVNYHKKNHLSNATKIDKDGVDEDTVLREVKKIVQESKLEVSYSFEEFEGSSLFL
jgi:hypothetical protein